MEFATGQAEAQRRSESFVNDAEAAAFWSEGAPDVGVEDHNYPGGAGQPQRVRIYRGGDGSAPTLLYVHGGGWVGGSIDLNERCARGLAHIAGCNVASISYRLAPAHPYPAALKDCLAAAGWLRTAGRELGLNPDTIWIGGASAGGNLALAASLASERGTFAGQVLFYPVAGADFETASYGRYADGPGLTRTRMRDMFDLYDPEGRRSHDPLVTPLVAGDFGRFPQTCLIAAEHDVLREDSVRLAERLREAGVTLDFHIERGVTHGFINRGRLVPSADAAIARAAGFVAGSTNGRPAP